MELEKATYKPSEAAQVLGVSLPTVYALIHRQQEPLPSFRVGKKLLVPKAQLWDWIDRSVQLEAALA